MKKDNRSTSSFYNPRPEDLCQKGRWAKDGAATGYMGLKRAGLQPESDGLHPSSDGLQPTSDGLQRNSLGESFADNCAQLPRWKILSYILQLQLWFRLLACSYSFPLQHKGRCVHPTCTISCGPFVLAVFLDHCTTTLINTTQAFNVVNHCCSRICWMCLLI